MGKLCGGQGPAEEVALSFRTVMGLKECALLLRFDALGNHALLEVLAHVNYGAHNRRAIGIGSDPMDKGLVNFQDINGKLLKIAEAGKAGAEVIHGKVNPQRFELLKYSGRRFGILHKDAFGELEVEIARFEAGFREYRPDRFDKTLVAKLDGGNINGNPLERQSRDLPDARLPACFAQQPTADLDNQATIFGDGHELGGKDESSVRLLPAYQRLDSRDLTRVEIYLRLIMQQELFSPESAAQAAFERLPLDSLQVHFRLEELEIVAPVFLGVVHGRVRILDQRFGILAVFRVDAYTDAAVNNQILSRDEVRCVERKKYSSCARGRVFRTRDLRKQDHEFITAQAADGV